MYTHKFIDGSPVPPDYLQQVGDFISEMAAFEDSLTPEEFDEMEREIERKRKWITNPKTGGK